MDADGTSEAEPLSMIQDATLLMNAPVVRPTRPKPWCILTRDEVRDVLARAQEALLDRIQNRLVG